MCIHPCLRMVFVDTGPGGMDNTMHGLRSMSVSARRYWEMSDQLLVRGWVLVSRLAFVRARWGDTAVEEILARLSPQDRAVWTQVDINEWYELRMIERFEKQVVRYSGEDELRLYEQMGEFSADRAFDPDTGHYRRFLGKPPELFLKLAAAWQNEYYSTGLTEYYPTGVTSCMIRTRYIPYTTRSNCRSNLGFFRRSIEILNGRNVRAEERRCLLDGDAWCEFHFQWEYPE